MMKLFKNNIQNKISYALGAVITAFFLFILVFDYGQNVKHGRQNLELELEFVSNYTSEAIKTPLWNLDDKTMQDVISAALTHPDIVFLSLENALTDKVIKINNDARANPSKNILYKDVELYHNSVKIGELSIGLSPYRNNQQIKKQLFMTGLKYLLLEILVVFSIRFVVRKIVSPLTVLKNRAKEISINNLNFTFELNGTEEIQTLAKSFNDMIFYLQKDFEIIQNQNQMISQFNQDLEIKIRERTQHLEDVIIELENTQEMLAESKKMASMGQLVSGMAHELNTPLGNGITSITYIINETDHMLDHMQNQSIGKNQLDHYLKTCYEACIIVNSTFNTLSKLIHQFKQLSDTVYLSTVKTLDLQAIILTFFDYAKTVYSEKDIHLDLKVHTSLKIASHPDVFMTLFRELFLNAFQHGFHSKVQGQISISVSVHANALEIVFIDDGIGIPEEHMPFIFNPFYTTSRAYDGTGLGLSILYNLVSSINGKISCQNLSPSGTAFTLSIPLSEHLKLDL